MRLLLLAATAALALVLGLAPTAMATWPGANGLISLSSGGDIHSTALGASSWTRLTTNPAAENAQSSWSPDGTRLVFRRGGPGDREVWVMNADGSGQRALTNTPAPGTFSSQPAWSPDGARILFRSDRDGNPDDADVWIMNADGSGVRQLANLAGDDRYPTFSPDGSRILFRSHADGDTEIATMAANGTDVRKLTDNTIFDGGPAWSPDGSRIAFERGPGQGVETTNADVFAMNADGSGVRQLTTDPAHDEGAAWSPDGTRMVFTSERSGNSDIWLMNVDGSGQGQVTTASSKEESPDWQPLPRAATPPVVPGPGPGPAGTPPTTRLCRSTQPPAIRTRTLARSGLRVRVRCARPAALRATLAFTAADARRARLGRSTLGRARRGRGARLMIVRVRISATTRRRLDRLPRRTLRRLRPRLTMAATDAAGRTTRTTATVRLNRY